MNKIKNYNDFILDYLLESLSSEGILPFVISERLRNLLNKMVNPISKDLLSITYSTNKPLTLLDITDKNDIVSLSSSPKIIEYLTKRLNNNNIEPFDFIKYTYKVEDEIWKQNRNEIKIGKLIKKIFGDKYKISGEPKNDIESFVNEYKSIFEKLNTDKLFELSDDIIKFYNVYNYSKDAEGSTLYNSCMNNKNRYLMFYVKNNIKILVLYEDSDKEKIVGRALVWKLDDPEGRYYMDRIYTVYDYQVLLFKEYAIKHQWLYKSKQTYGQEKIVDPINNTSNYMNLTINNIKLCRYYPYLDTLQYLDQDNKILSTEKISDIKLISTDGTSDGGEWSEKYDRLINLYNYADEYVTCNVGMSYYADDIDKLRLKKDAIYLDYYEDYIATDMYDDLIKTTIGPKYLLLKKDVIYLKYYKEWTSKEYAEIDMYYSKYNNDYFKKEDSIYSRTIDSYILKKTSSKVYLDSTKTDFDYLPDSELPKLSYLDKNKNYILKYK